MPDHKTIKFEPLWWEDAPLYEIEQVKVNAHCDVAIIGAGYTGLAAALELARAGANVQVFESQRAGEGASTRNGGMFSGKLPCSIPQAIKRFGAERAKSMFDEGRLAREDLARFVSDEGIECDFKLTGRFTGALCQADVEEMRADVERINEFIGVKASIVERKDLPAATGSSLYHGGMLRPDIGTFDPAKFHRGLLGKVIAAGVTIHDLTPAISLKRITAGFEIETARGACTASKLIVATNGYTDGASPWLRRRIVPIVSRMIATAPLPREQMERLMPQSRACGELRKLYRYYRPSPDGLRILIGAREPAFGNSTKVATNFIASALHQIYPELRDVELSHSWAGYVAYTRDEMPSLFEHDGAVFSCGYCGSGTVWARWLGIKAARRVLGDDVGAQTEFFRKAPSAIPLYRGKPWFLPVAMSWYGLKDYMKFGMKR